MLRQYFDGVREQFRLFCQGETVPRQPIKNGEKYYLFATPIVTEKSVHPLFVPLSVILGRLHDQALHYEQRAGAAEILGVKKFSLSLLEVDMTLDDNHQPLGKGHEDVGYYRRQFNSVPVYHDYDVPSAYTWDYFSIGQNKSTFSIYQAEFLIYCLARTPLTYRLFMKDIVNAIAKNCSYTAAEKAQLEDELLQLHLNIYEKPFPHRVFKIKE